MTQFTIELIHRIALVMAPAGLDRFACKKSKFGWLLETTNDSCGNFSTHVSSKWNDAGRIRSFNWGDKCIVGLWQILRCLGLGLIDFGNRHHHLGSFRSSNFEMLQQTAINKYWQGKFTSENGTFEILQLQNESNNYTQYF